MSALRYDGPRRFSRTTSARAFPETYYSGRHASLEYTRADPYGYPTGGPVSSLRARSHSDQDEYQVEQGGSRRRIAVACARCRKRKIRCSGDKGDGQGCHNCRQAGVSASQCQFHRVGSDHVHKVMDNFNMAQSLANMATAQEMMPLYSTSNNRPYHRGAQNEQQYAQLDAYSPLDTKPTYNSDWAGSHGDGTSSIGTYPFDQSPTYLPAPPIATDSNMCSPPYRWTQPTARTNQTTTSCYPDYSHSYVSHGLPYLQTDIRESPVAESVSPLDMSSLQLTLPERPRQRQLQPTEVPIKPRRRLPAPQPNPGHGLHHALDQQQGQRLRSSQTIAAPSFSNAVPSYTNAKSFVKPLLPWTAANENLMNAVNGTTAAAMVPPLTVSAPTNATDISTGLFPTSTSPNGIPSPTGTAPSQELNFSTLSLLDPSIMAAPVRPAYSNFRESRGIWTSPKTQIPRNDSSSSLYVYDSPRASFLSDDAPSNLVSGHRYTPLSQATDTPTMENLTRESFEARNVPLHRASTSSLNTGL